MIDNEENLPNEVPQGQLWLFAVTAEAEVTKAGEQRESE